MKEKLKKASKDTGFLLKVLKVLSVEAVQVELFRFNFLDTFVFHNDALCMFEYYKLKENKSSYHSTKQNGHTYK